jgi:glycosyltransferase involved in cell wall biosynthesis
VFVEAVQRAHRLDSRIRGLVVGGGPELERLRNLASRDASVQVAGERTDVTDLVSAADVACLSSTAEGVPMAILEAMALARPVVATVVGGVGVAVVSGETGYLVEVGDVDAFVDALVRLAADPALASRLGDAGRERHRALFGVDRMIDGYARVIEETLTARGTP